MKPRAFTARNVLLSSAAMAFTLFAGTVYAEEKPANHTDGPAAAYEPSMTTLGQIKVEIPGRKEGDPVMTQEESRKAPRFTLNAAPVATVFCVKGPRASL